ncbi:hypothetical protein B6N58_05245 [Legionella micdadei]|uniref:Uncharacterized protein n=2 Tax=Legionella micdadei TaxID=451 RepID=A0A098GG55_LEGMI|nr:hypothetical protein [Legionella micdadei]ARG97113.1 hypothetical protein B6N58_05245 [Legionella micdadei]ARH00629.1 hypothetical protein B6V88_09455 [Legionella micdadei]KTD29292.1 hypothetical protein Lmic_1212 [Legionella micdadei]NSL17335.1 hypothetical protein [Legionella micdadei]CEG61448.1 conserved exported protein of unknown function [Legionella micdadei]
MLRGVIVFFMIILPVYSFADDTELKLYRPFADGTPVVIKEVIPGQCWQQSQRIKREDAWRCVAANKVYDPCFVKEYGSHKEAVCPQSPWVGDSVQINLSTPVDNTQNTSLDMAEAYPWAVELTTGEKCQAVDDGAVYDGMKVHYQCNSQTVLIGRVQRCEAKWSILQRTPSGISTALVAKAWF